MVDNHLNERSDNASQHRWQEYMSCRFFPDLDGIRAFSILFVIYHHADMSFSLFRHREYLGVDMFFVLSGFLIVTLLMRERDRTGAISLINFYIRRVLRIFPVYFATVIGLAILLYVADAEPDYLRALPWYLTFTVNFCATPGILFSAWSLAAEEQFYALWPVIEKTFVWKQRIAFLILFLLLNQMLNFGLLDKALLAIGIDRGLYNILQATFTPIGLGVGAAWLLHQRGSFAWSDRFLLLGERLAPLLMLVSLFWLLNLENADISGLHRLSMQLVMTLLLMSLVTRNSPALLGSLRTRYLVRIGQVSYGMYLFHFPVVRFFQILKSRGVDLNEVSTLILVCLVTYLAAEFSFRYFESPILALRTRYRTLQYDQSSAATT